MKVKPPLNNDVNYDSDLEKDCAFIRSDREDIVKDATIIVHGPWEDQTTDKRIREQQ